MARRMENRLKIVDYLKRHPNIEKLE